MAEREVASDAKAEATEADEAERALGRAVSRGLPVVAVAGALLAGSLAGVGAGLLTLAAGALLGTIALLWASLRTLSGDTALPVELETLASRRPVGGDLVERKDRAVRALKDLESEHALGKIDDEDYADLYAKYYAEAKNLLRALDDDVAPRRAEAERIAQEYLRKQNLTGARHAPANESSERVARRRVECAGCGASNEPDATFCKKCGSKISPTATESSNPDGV